MKKRATMKEVWMLSREDLSEKRQKFQRRDEEIRSRTWKARNELHVKRQTHRVLEKLIEFDLTVATLIHRLHCLCNLGLLENCKQDKNEWNFKEETRTARSYQDYNPSRLQRALRLWCVHFDLCRISQMPLSANKEQREQRRKRRRNARKKKKREVGKEWTKKEKQLTIWANSRSEESSSKEAIIYNTYSATFAPPCALRNFCSPITVFNNCPTKRPFMKSSHPERLPSLSTFCL